MGDCAKVNWSSLPENELSFIPLRVKIVWILAGNLSQNRRSHYCFLPVLFSFSQWFILTFQNSCVGAFCFYSSNLCDSSSAGVPCQEQSRNGVESFACVRAFSSMNPLSRWFARPPREIFANKRRDFAATEPRFSARVSFLEVNPPSFCKTCVPPPQCR